MTWLLAAAALRFHLWNRRTFRRRDFFGLATLALNAHIHLPGNWDRADNRNRSSDGDFDALRFAGLKDSTALQNQDGRHKICSQQHADNKQEKSGKRDRLLFAVMLFAVMIAHWDPRFV